MPRAIHKQPSRPAQPRHPLVAARALLWLWVLLLGAFPGAPSIASGAAAPGAPRAGAPVAAKPFLLERQQAAASAAAEDLDGDGDDRAAVVASPASCPLVAGGLACPPGRAFAPPGRAFPHFRARAPPLG